MCGVVGFCALGEAAPARAETLRAMLGAIRHRGPDQFGIYLDGPTGLGNARLSIIDLSTGQQPISNEDGTLWIVFNGEIFNHPELRLELEARGHRYATSCDTETVLHAYEEFGPDCLSRFNGQFAIAIWDTVKRTLFLARDRLGVRPLFYAQGGGSLVFGSEIKAILAHPDVAAEADPGALDEIFTYWSTLSPRTFFKGVRELPPGHHLLVRDGQVALEPWWEMGFPEPGPVRSLADCAAELRELLIDATRLRLRADVPVGAYLSGGLDSSTITAIIRTFTSNPLETFSIAFDDPAFDESGFQASMARSLGTRHHVVHASHADIGRIFPEVVWHAETPMMRTSPAPMFLLSGLVRRKDFKVVLTGEGADEFLAGYDLFKEARIRRFWAARPDSKLRQDLFGRIYPWIAGLTQGNASYASAFFGMGLSDTGARDYSHAIRWRTTARAKRFFSPGFVERVGPARSPAYPEGFDGWDPLHQAQFLEISIFLSQYLLSSQSDRMAMGHSVEGRFPFLDYRVVDFCNRLPPGLKLRGLTEKFLLKEVSREWLPPEITDRPKQPFRAPIQRAFFGPSAPEYLEELLSPAAIADAGYFNPRAVDQLVAKLRQGHAHSETDDMALAGIVSTQLVHRQFLSGFKPSPALDGSDDIKVVTVPAAPQQD
ncbi:asparagine synthase (glutamine-hydrolyzing) [Mesoterricola silvestris]|uniref:asparagine synthase (glutamine-hydrolyzing) n=1 Tax=Mesoterricola silvestris TaxID=2927979 RepID=A0AA48GMG4_9BACT|nr:asparagine synthase (glutamine-hydrolyzing) [Mesoterricola silvestris]BDU74127.1 asparagine synthetase B [Mesoterricola silvestris]